MGFIDKCKLYVKAGDGGDGIVSWRREAHVPMGGPAGGNGGNGGNIYFIGDHNETSLEFLKYTKKILAKPGEKGDIKNMHGRNAEDVYVKIPLGTTVTNTKTKEVLADITIDGKKYLIAEGGLGGHGNAHFKSGYNKAPTLYECGEKGQDFELMLELKELADVGLIGLPNAGKSTLISKLTNAKPKIANYQFTTLIPILGAIDNGDQKIIIADIPGLIEGASEGVGLGHEFLRHIERCRILAHVISLDSDDNPDVLYSIETIFNELKKYNEKLIDKKIILIANKSDALDAEENLALIKKHYPQYQLFVTSALEGEGIDELKEFIINEYNDLVAYETFSQEEIVDWNQGRVERDSKLSRELTLTQNEDGMWVVQCDFLEYWVHRVPINTPDNLIRFNQKLATVQLEDKLREAGAEPGDMVDIYGVQIEYEE
ncbi:GTPase ObgE [Ureaplasma ceti]|uniref:GTPase Obg n=1 Tax=Ureaplasma ceti TaxID=3119530 RepID=A0ABP9U8R2_9BACT